MGRQRKNAGVENREKKRLFHKKMRVYGISNYIAMAYMFSACDVTDAGVTRSIKSVTSFPERGGLVRVEGQLFYSS